jgi:site-specific recombinase XerD
MTENVQLMPITGSLAAVTMPIDENPAAIYLAGLKESGRRSMRQVLNLVAGLLTGDSDALSCPWASLRFQHVSAIRAQLEGRYKPATVNKTLAALRGVLRAAWQSGKMTAEDYQMAVSVKSVKNTTLPAGRELTGGELASLMNACENDRTPAGIRDAAIIGTMYAAGLRREEVTTLDLADYEAQTGQLVIRGKGNKERTAYLPTGGAQALGAWLIIRGKETGSLFYHVNKGGCVIPKRITPQAVYNLLDKRAIQAGVKDFSPHDLRRTFVSDLLDSGADIVTVAKMAGHASVTTTARYDRRPEEAKRKAASLLHVPYRGHG